MNKTAKREKTTYFVKSIMTLVAGLAAVACFLEEKLLLSGLYIGMALIFLFSMVINVFRIGARKAVEKKVQE